MFQTINDALARIAISKNVIKEYKTSESERTVYLDNGTEFQIYIKNPYQNHLGIDIYVNEKSIGNRLVLRPGQSVWLERFMNDEHKFLFETYEVEDTNETHYAINKNGKVRLDFYHEKEEEVHRYEYQPWNGLVYYDTCINTNDYKIKDIDSSNCTIKGIDNNLVSTTCLNCVSDGVVTNSALSQCKNFTNASTSISTSINAQTFETGSVKKSIETGRVEKGSHSDQKFQSCDIKFDYSPFTTERLLILPRSRKQNFAEDTIRKYCSQCGKKVKPTDKFCSNCGAKLQ